MFVFKEYEKPIQKEQIIVKPIMAKLGPAFKKEAGKIAEALSKIDPIRLEESLKEKGYFQIEKLKVLPEHVDIKHEKTVERGRRFIPYVIEPTFGSDRLFYIAFEYSYRVKDDRALLSFPRDIAPVQLGVYPLVSKDGLPEKALEIRKILVNEGFVTEYDDAGSIGRRYARADEAGVALNVTVDYNTPKDGTVTIRDRDSWKQVRWATADLPELLHKYFAWKLNFEQLGNQIQA
jgi:glycyl-tRNA synthetase